MGAVAGLVRVVVAEAGDDADGREGEAVARALRDAGVEVVYAGLRQTPDLVVRTAIQEDADAIGLFARTDAGALLTAVLELLREHEAMDILVFGGAVPEVDVPALKGKGVAEVFATGVAPRSVAEWVRGHVRTSGMYGG